MKPVVLESLIESAINFRTELFDEKHEAAFRLFNGFTEGKPNLVVDLYAKTWSSTTTPNNPIRDFLPCSLHKISSQPSCRGFRQLS